MTPAQVTPTSDRGRALLSQGALNAVMREAGAFAGEQWIALKLPLRFDRAYAVGLGYVTSQRRGKVHSKYAKYKDLKGNPTSEGLTYDERKLNFQGHMDPLVWTGRMRAEIYRWASTRVVSTRYAVRVEIALGRLNVGNARSGYRQLPADSMARRVLTAFPSHEREWVREQIAGYVGARLGAIGSRVSSAARLPDPPPVLTDGTMAANQARLTAADRYRSARDSTIRRMQDRFAGRASLHEQWRRQSGGSSPFDKPPRSPAEAKAAHRGQALASYHRRRSSILARRRAARSFRAAFRRLTPSA